jgi:DNA repair protein RadC
VYVKELTVRYRLRRVRGTLQVHGRVDGPRSAAEILVPLLRHEVVEVFAMLCLSTRLDVLAYHEVSRGTLNATVVTARDVFRTALLTHAASVVVAHNHPSGDVTPSPADHALTTRLFSAGELLDVEVADHLIVGVEGSYYSFKEAGQFPLYARRTVEGHTCRTAAPR